jgi:uncharacterized protein YneF (UPF0154 family)
MGIFLLLFLIFCVLLVNILDARLQKNPPLTAQKLNQAHTRFGQQWKQFQEHEQQLRVLRLGPEPADPQELLRCAVPMLSIAALCDSLYHPSPALRRSLNRGDRGNHIPSNALQHTRDILYDRALRKELSRWQSSRDTVQTSRLNLSPATTALWLKNLLFRQKERFMEAQYEMIHSLGRAFGMFVGRFEGPNDAAKNARQLASLLRPLDIVMMKSPQRLTDRLIPGYFGHVAVCLSTPGTDKGNTPTDPEQIRMIEAVRKSGVRISSLEDFAEGKTFLILRPVGLTQKQQQTIRNNLLKQLNKAYDFHYNVFSLDRIACTELIYAGFDHVLWETERVAGRYILSPDAIVTSAQAGGMFETPAFLDNGSLLRDPSWDTIRKHMAED